MKKLMLLLTIYGFLSCGEDGSLQNPNNPGDDEQITAAQHNNLPTPCLENASFMQLPSELQVEANYSQFDYTNAVVEGISNFKLKVAESQSTAFPPTTALVAPVDDIKVFEGDEAYYWLSGDNKLLYRVREEGYSIFYYRMPSSITAAESIYVDQNIDCSTYSFVDYVVGDSPNVGKHNLRINYNLAGTAHIIEMETNTWEPDFLREKYRFFDDGSGEYTQYIGGDISMRVLWESNGSGTYSKYENSLETDSGTFSF